MFKTILSNVKQYKAVAICTPVFAALEVFMEVLIPYITAWLIDEGVTPGNINMVYKYGAMMLVISLFSLTFAIIAGKSAAKASTGFAANIRNALYRKIQTFSFANIDKFSTGSLITRLTTDVNNIQMAFQMSLRMAVRAPLTLISSLIMCFIINKKISLIFVAAILVLTIVLGFGIVIVGKRFSKVFEKYDNLNNSVQENVTAIRVVKAFVREDYEIEKFGKASDLLNKVSIYAEKITALAAPIMTLVVDAIIISISWFAAKFIVAGEMTTGNLTSFFSYIASIMMSLLMLSAFLVFITMSIASIKRIGEVLVETPTISEPENPVYEVKDGSIKFNNVSFSYGQGRGENVLENLNLEIKSGETIGIIGGTGSGKTSLVNLISRLYDVSSGSVEVGGEDVRNYNLDSLRNSVAVVLQKSVLFSGTILDNLRWGKEDASFEECVNACKIAQADDFIMQFPDKYETVITQGGTNVSGGQKQRIAIARALLKSPKVLILDDSTSAVDTATDSKIREQFASIIPGVTKLIIAQRISSVMDADKIIVLDNGKIAGFADHDTLLENNDIYREIYDTQTSAGGDFDESKPRKEV